MFFRFDHIWICSIHLIFEVTMLFHRMMSNNTNDNSTAVLRRVQRPLSRDLLADEEFYRSLPVFDMFPLSNGYTA
jgi:hypothetical protein